MGTVCLNLLIMRTLRLLT